MHRLRHLLSAALITGALALSAGPGAAWAEGEIAPDFELQDVNSGAGKVKLSSYTAEGKAVLLNFWATWCQPCQVEMPHLQRIGETYKDAGLQVVVVSIDDARARNMIKPMCKRAGATFPVVHDAQTKVVTQYNPAKTLPYTVLIDKEGKIAKVHMGYNPGDEGRLEAEVCEVLGLSGDACKAPAQ